MVAQTAVDIGARIVGLDAEGRVQRIEAAGARLAAEVGLALEMGGVPDAAGVQRLVERMADRLFEAVQRRHRCMPTPQHSCAWTALPAGAAPDIVTFSGGVSEYIYGREARSYGDLGPALAQAVLSRVRAWGPRIEQPEQGIRATVVGASQYTVQVSGSTIFVEPPGTLPLRNMPVITPALPLDGETLDAEAIADAVRAALRRLDLHEGEQPVALCYRWAGIATFCAAGRFLPRRGCRPAGRAARAAGRWCWWAMATSAGWSASICMRSEAGAAGHQHRRHRCCRSSTSSTSARCWTPRAQCRWSSSRWSSRSAQQLGRDAAQGDGLQHPG